MNQSINVSSEQVRFKQTSERVYTDGRVPDEIWERVPATWLRSLRELLITSISAWRR